MSYLDQNEAFEHFKAKTLEAIQKQFPIDGRKRVLELDGLEVEDNLHPDDIRSQHQAKVNGQTWGVPVYAKLSLKDKETGKVIDAKRVRIAELPKVTKRYSHIVNGQEYQINNQWQLRPGAYVRRRQSGELETRFQTAGRKSFDITFDEDSKVFKMEYDSARLPLYPIVSALGVSDAELEKRWGKTILEANKNARKASVAVEQFYKSTKKAPPASYEEALRHLRDTLQASKLRPDATAITLGKPVDHVNGEALTLATHKMLKVQSGHPEDDRDSILFKDLRSVGDFAYDKINSYTRTIRDKASRKINTTDNVREIIKFDTINKPILETFTKNSAAELAKQVNPVEMLSVSQQTTVMGPGGIQSEQSIMEEAKYVNPSHMAFLDPVNTPEGSRTGITLRLPIGVRKQGNEPQVPLYNVRTGRTEYVNPKRFLESNVVLPDQVKWVNGKPKPVANSVKASTKGNDVDEIDFGQADYVMRHPSQLFNATSNLIPFLNNTSGGRANMAARHIEQAISLLDREAPLVQVATPAERNGIGTFEQLIGRQASHSSPVAGKVKAIKDDAIIIEAKDGSEHEVQIYKNYPLNDTKSVLDSVPRVKPGDTVKAGEVVADTNFSRDGALALGTNLRVAYIPYKGYNFEDGVVISESAAKKLSSVHLHKPDVALDRDTQVNKRLFMSQHHGAFTKSQLDLVDDDGVVKIGTKVKPGDPLVLATKRSSIVDKSGLGAIRKSLGAQYVNKALTWEGDAAGEVVGVHRKGDQIFVHVKTIEPMQVGDKITGRYGNKGIVTRVLPDSEMPRLPSGDPIEVALNPSGVPGRMNVGQVLETAASKIARKTGKPYVVDNFERTDMLEKVKNELKKHNLKDTEPLFDPVTNQPLGEALVGYQHMLKLHHQVDKKVAARSGLSLPGEEPEKYDINLQPAGGGHRGGQAMDHLGLYSLLAHGAKANVREMHTWKAEGPDPNTNPSKQWQSQHHDVWDAIQHGDPLPTPKPTFAFNKFVSMLKGAGINVEKKGHDFILTPLTDKAIKEMSGDRVLSNPADLLYAKIDPKTGEPKPRAGGLFDEKLTGGHGGHKWSRIELAEPIPNPVFESSIRALTGLSDKEYAAVVNGEKAVSPTGKIVDLGKGVTGGAGIKLLLDRIDPARELSQAKKELNTTAAAKNVDAVLKKVKRLQMLEQTGLKPSEAYILTSIPVLPPVMRPISLLPDGNFKYADINQLYSRFAQTNDKLKDPVLKQNLTEEGRQALRRNLYDGVRAIVGIGVPYKDAEHKGLIHQIAGAQPKTGYFQHTLTSRKQDMSMRSTIVPEPALGLDEVGLPKQHALRLFAPFVVNQLKTTGLASNVAEAQKMVAEQSPFAFKALDKVVEDRPVLLKRDPALHKYSVQAFRPKLVAGNAIQIHPLVTGGYNADFDGDSIDLETPILLRIRGNVTLKTGRELLQLLGAGDGNYVCETQGIEAHTYSGWRRVKTVSFHEVREKKKYKIVLNNGVSFIASEDHSLMSGQQQRKPGELTVGTRLDNVRPLLADEGQGWGYYQGVAYGNLLGDGRAEVDGLLNLGEEFLNGLLAGYILADGVVEGTEGGSYVICIWSRSKKLRDGMSLVASMLGLPHSLRERVADGERSYGLWFGKEAIRLIDYRCAGDKGDLIRKARADYLDEKNDAGHLHSERGFEIRSIEEVEYNDRMIDLEVDGPEHVFTLLGGVVVHNTMSVFVPISDEARRESLKMVPSNNIFSEATGKVMYQPTLESALGLYKLSRVNEGPPVKKFKDYAEAIEAARAGKVKVNDPIKVGANQVTVGRVLLATALPEPMQKPVLEDFNLKLDKEGLDKLLTEVARKHKEDFGVVANKLKDIGNGASFGVVAVEHSNFVGPNRLDPKQAVYVPVGTHTLSLNDFTPDKSTKNKVFNEFERQAKALLKKPLPKAQKETKLVEIWKAADGRLKEEHLKKHEKNPSNLLLMAQAKVKPSYDQYKQMVLAPMLVQDSAGRIVPKPIKRSYSEGLDVGEYWTQMSGARRGAVLKVQEVEQPGYLSKLLMATTMDNVVSGADCGTRNGISMSAFDKEVHDRYLAKDFSSKGVLVPAGTLLTPDVLAKIRTADKNAQVMVRSSLKCEHEKGICQRCLGLSADGQHHKIGENIGVISAQSLGERAVQLTMKEFHQGGAISSGAGGKALVNSFERFKQLTMLPKKVPNSATLAKVSGQIERIEQDPTGVKIWIGGKAHHVAKDPAGNPLWKPLGAGAAWQAPKVGAKVERGQPLSDPSRTVINPHELYKTTRSMNKVQNYLTEEIYNLSKSEGVKRKSVEVLVKSMGNLTKVKESGDAEGILRGEFHPFSRVEALNRELMKAGKKPIEHEPVLKGVLTLPLSLQEDWMAKLQHARIENTLLEAAATMGRSNIHGTHPIPAVAYGAEFGMTSEHAKNKSVLKHLENVPIFSY